MDAITLLNNLKKYLKITDESEDEFLNFLLVLSNQKVLDRLYPFDDTVVVVPSRYQPKVIEIAIYLYNKQGAEGQTTHNENGINRTYESSDVPESLMRGITPFVGSPIHSVSV